MGIPSIPPGPGVMSRAIDAEVYVWSIVTAAIVVIITALRFYATKLGARPIQLEDWFALIAGAVHVAYCIMCAWIVAYVNGRDPLKLTSFDRAYVSKIAYAAVPIFPLNQFFAKFSLFLLYHRLFGINKTFVHWMWFWGSLQVISSVITFFVSLFTCTPVAKYWDPSLKGTCIDHNKYVAGSATVNSSVDFGMVALAVWIVHGLCITRAHKWKLAILFAFGGAAGILGLVKIGEVYAVNDPLQLASALWTGLQQAASCVCCCAPAFGVFFQSTDSTSHTVDTKSRLSKRHPYGSSRLGPTVSDEERIVGQASATFREHSSSEWYDDPREYFWTEAHSTAGMKTSVPLSAVNVARDVNVIRE